jgi:hypothetical protein
MEIVQPKPHFDTNGVHQAGWLHENRFRALQATAFGFLRLTMHFAEMWLAMLVGTEVFASARHWLAIVGDRSLLDPRSIQSEVGHGIFMTVPMLLWMRIRGYRWRENIEMALGMIVPWAALLALDRFGGVLHGLPWLSERNAMAAGMLTVMLYHTWAGRFPPLRSR